MRFLLHGTNVLLTVHVYPETEHAKTVGVQGVILDTSDGIVIIDHEAGHLYTYRDGVVYGWSSTSGPLQASLRLDKKRELTRIRGELWRAHSSHPWDVEKDKKGDNGVNIPGSSRKATVKDGELHVD